MWGSPWGPLHQTGILASLACSKSFHEALLGWSTNSIGTIQNLHYTFARLPSGHISRDCERQVPYSNITKHFFAPKLLWVSFRLALHFLHCSHLKCPLPASPKSHHPVCLLQIPSPAALTGPLLLWNSVMFVVVIIGRTLSSQPGQTVLGNRLCFKSLLFSVTCNTIPHNIVSNFLT